MTTFKATSNNKFNNFKYVSADTLGRFYDNDLGFVTITHMLDKGAIRFGYNFIEGNYWDLVEFFIDSCTPHHQLNTEFWADSELVKQAWADYYKLNISDTKTALDLADKSELVLAAYQEFGEFYKDLYAVKKADTECEHKHSLESIDKKAAELGLCYNNTEGAETPSADTDNEVTIDHDKLSWYYASKIYHKVFDKVGGCPADFETFKFAVEDYASSLAQVTFDYYEPVGEYMHVMHISNADYDINTHKLTVEYHDFVGKGETPQIGFCFRPKDCTSYDVGSYDGKKDKDPLLNYDKIIVADFVADNDTQVGA